MMGDELRVGMRVRTSDGADLGRVVELRGDTATVQKGLLVPRRLVVAMADVAEIRGGDAILAATTDEVRLERIDAPEEDGGREAGGIAPSGGRARDVPEEIRIPVAEEEVLVEKHAREVGAVSIRKRVVTEQREIVVPVRREEIVVERVPARAGAPEARPEAAPFEERTLTIPLYEEEIEIVKRPRLREEVHVSKVVRQVRHVEQAAVRRAEVHVEPQGAARLHGDDGGDPDR